MNFATSSGTVRLSPGSVSESVSLMLPTLAFPTWPSSASTVMPLEWAYLTTSAVFPLFGATDQEQSFYLSNELSRSFADKINAKIKYAWFPYLPDCTEDCKLFKRTSYYRNLTSLWNSIDIAIIGIGNSDIIQNFGKIFGYNENCFSTIGDISTYFLIKTVIL